MKRGLKVNRYKEFADDDPGVTFLAPMKRGLKDI